MVSHDRSFIKRVASQIIEIRDGFVEIYPGNYDDYLWSLVKGSLKERHHLNSEINQAQVNTNQTKSSATKFNYKELQKKISSEIKELQRKILKTEEILFQNNKKVEEFNNLLLQNQGAKAQQIAIESSQLSQSIIETEEVLLTHMENLEQKEKELSELSSTSTLN